MDDEEPRAWLEIEPGERFVRYGDLAHRLAKALHPVPVEDEDFDFHYGFARAQFDEELSSAVEAGLMVPRNPLTGGKHTFPFGAALEDAVINLQDLRAFARDRDIGVRVRAAASPSALPDTAAEPAPKSPDEEFENARQKALQAARVFRVLDETARSSRVLDALFASDEPPTRRAELAPPTPPPAPAAEPAPPTAAQAPAIAERPADAKRWTPERLKELQDYRAAHGTKKAAEWAGVSSTRVRALLPRDKPQPKGYSAFNPRVK